MDATDRMVATLEPLQERIGEVLRKLDDDEELNKSSGQNLRVRLMTQSAWCLSSWLEDPVDGLQSPLGAAARPIHAMVECSGDAAQCGALPA